MNAHTLQATQIVDRIVSGWRAAPTVKIVQATADLPVRVPADVRGMWRSGEAYIVSGTQPLSMVGDTLAHEALGHCGLREVLGGSWGSFMLGVQSGLRAGDGRLRCFRDDVRAAYVDTAGVFNLNATQESDEIAAAIVESRFHSPSGRLRVQQPLRKLMQAASGHFSREVLYRDRPVDFDQLLGTILIAEHRLRYGGAFFGLGFRLKGWYAPPMPKFDPNAPPMTLAESERLLKEEDERVAKKGGWPMEAISFATLLAFLAVIGLILLFGPTFEFGTISILILIIGVLALWKANVID